MSSAKEPYYQFVIENEYVSFQSMMALLQNNKASFQFLLLNGYIRQAPSGLLAVNFVGVVTIGETVICCLPKYFKLHNYQHEELIQPFATIIKVLKRIGYSDFIPDAKHINSSDRINSSEMVLADKILKDFLEHGFFNKKKDLVSHNANGETDWARTVHLIDPIFHKGQPIYTDTYNSSVVDEEFNLITELHKWSVNYFLSKYGPILDYSFSFPGDCVTDLSELGALELITDALTRELAITYTDREIILLQRLLAFLTSNHVNSANWFSIFGTGYYNLVWENVCAAIFKNRLHHFQDKMPLPVWKDFSRTVAQKDTLKPDIISVRTDELFFVLDAKYYNLTYTGPPSLDVLGNPGIGDIGKQFLYADAFKNLPFRKTYNCFLFPKFIDSFFEVVGFVEFSLFPGKTVYNIYISPNDAYHSYLNNFHKGQVFLKNIADTIDALHGKQNDAP